VTVHKNEVGELENREIYDVTIIGAGCAGLFAANYAGLRGMKTKVIDFLPKTGGSVAVFYPEKNIYDIGGIPKISGQQLVDQLFEQAMMYEPTLVLNQEVTDLQREENGLYVLTTHSGDRHFTRTVIIAVGAGTYKIRHLQIKDGYLQEGEHIHYEPMDLSGISGRRVAVYGGLSAAVQRAMALSETAEQVTLIHNREQLNALDEEQEALAKSPVIVKKPYTITDVREDEEGRIEVFISDANGRDERLVVDDLIISHGYHFDLEPLKKWGFTFENRRIPVNNKMETKFEGVYAAGDIAGYPNKWRLISSAFTEAITAVNSAKKYLDPSAPSQVYSTFVRK
jgi:thioredoxin reductase